MQTHEEYRKHFLKIAEDTWRKETDNLPMPAEGTPARTAMLQMAFIAADYMFAMMSEAEAVLRGEKKAMEAVDAIGLLDREALSTIVGIASQVKGKMK